MKVELKDKERIDDLQRNGYQIIQNPEKFCFGMDAVLLTGFAHARERDTMLDLGTGTGIIPLLMEAKYHCSHLTGLEIQEESADMARRSVALNDLQDRIDIVTGDIKEADRIFQAASFDCITCNPPYMIGEHGLTLVKPGDGILTHCNAGQLATSKYGTVTAPIYLGEERGYHFRVFADETRPLLQGARLTAFELQSSGVDVTLICDNMSATVMKNGWVNAVFVGCDRVAANGDAANKIGTSVVAAVAKYYGVPVYICAPTSTIDLNTPTGAEIKIEQRPAEEVTEMWYKERMAPEGIKVFNPAFDVTDHELIAGIVTEYGVARAPYTESLAAIFAEKEKRAREKKEA